MKIISLKKGILHGLLSLLLSLTIPFVVLAQGKSKDVIALEKKADKMFRQQEFTHAKDIYSTLLSNYPKNPFYSFRFGVCLLYGDRRNLEKPLQYLELAAKSPDIDKEVFYYLGQAYHFNYRFTDAIRLYQKYRGMVSDNKAAKRDVDRQIEMCQNGLYLLSRVKDLYVVQRKEVKRSDFYRTYDLTGFGGEILQEPIIFKSKLDKKKGSTGLVFFPKKQDIVLFSSYGPNDDNGKDIYYSTMLPDMTWAKPQKLPGIVNTPYDEDYPFLLPDGRTLYFASKGHNSMGGYDIFKSTLDTITGNWRQPENLDFAINTPFDDLLFVTDPYQYYAYFSSNRASVEENIMVYMVRVDKRPDKIQEINLDQPLAGTDSEDDKTKRSVEIVKQMANLSVNADNDNFKDTLAAIALVEISRTKSIEKTKDDQKEYSSTLKDRIKEKEDLQFKVDSAFVLVGKMEESVKKLDKVVDNVQQVSLLTTDRQQKAIADRISGELAKESTKKKKKLEQAKMLSGAIQQLSATGKPDSANILYQSFKDRIVVSDTISDYPLLVKNTIAGNPVISDSKGKDDFMSGFKAVKSKEEKEKATDIIDQASVTEITFVTKVITPKDDSPGIIQQPIVEKKKAEEVAAIATPPSTSNIVLPRNPEVANRIINTVIAQKDTLKHLQLKTQRQKLLLLANALDKSNASGEKLAEVNNMQGILETVITEGSVRDMKIAIKKMQSEGAILAEEAVLYYSLASKLGDREKTISDALKEVENQAIIIEKTLDSGKVEKASVLTDILVEPIKDFASHCNSNDDIISATHRHARNLKISVLTNFKQARQLAVSSKSSSDMAINLRKQADSHMDKEAAKNLVKEAEVMEKQAADRQKDAMEIFNQNIIWQNRSKALENSLPKSRKILDDIERKVKDENFKPPRKRIKDTVLLVPVMLDLLANNLPQNDTAYEKLAVYTINRNQPVPKANEEILRRTEFAVNVDDKLLATQQNRKQDRFDQLEFKKIDPKELLLREKLAKLNDTVGIIRKEESIQENLNYISQWELDKPSFVLLKKQVDTLYYKIKRQPQLRLPSTLSGLFEELDNLTDSLSGSFYNYRKARMVSAGKQDTSKIAMTLELEAFEVKATANRMKYLINRMRIGELVSTMSNPEITSRPQPDSLIALEYFYEADTKRESSTLTKDKKRQLQLLRQADELEKNGIQQQLKLEGKMKEGPPESSVAVITKDEAQQTKLNSKIESEQKSEQKIDNKLEIKPEEKKEIVQEVKPEVKPEIKKEIKPEPKPVSKPKKDTVIAKVTEPLVAKKQEVVPEIKKVAKTEVKKEVKTEPQKVVKPEVKDVIAQIPKPLPKPEVTPEPKAVGPETPLPQKAAPSKPFISKFVERSPISLSAVEITAVENEIKQASERKSLPQLPGLMYSVQVGVYKTGRSSAQLFNINPLFEDIMNNGNYRYFSGIFGVRNDAIAYKNEMVQKGVTDAFVIIFYKGKRVTPAEAAALSGEAITNFIPQSKIDVLVRQRVSGTVSDVYFSVQLAAYRRPMTDKELSYYRQKVNGEIKTYVTESGLSVLVTGEFRDYNACLNARKQIVNQGITDAFLVGFVEGKRVKSSDARQALNPVP